MRPIDSVPAAFAGKGFEIISVTKGASFKAAKTVVIIPTRGMIHHRVVQSWQNLMAPMNQARAILFASGNEVGDAYNGLISHILQHPDLSQWQYVLTVEDDNLVPADAHIRLIESIEETGADAVSGIYFTKGEVSMPMAYGDPEEFRKTGVLDFRPRSPGEINQALAKGQVLEVNGIAMGCALWRMDLFRFVPPPWFVTVSDVIPGIGPMSYTQDLKFCERAKRLGKRFAVDFRVKVGHLDINTGTVY
jgi:hypothetical protein